MLYTTGTVSVTNGSYIVTGSGTSWSSLSLPLIFGTTTGGSYEVTRIVSDTVLWISEVYEGASGSSMSYKITNSFTVAYSFPFTTTRDARQADTLSSLLLAVEKKKVELDGGAVVTNTRSQQYTTGKAKFVEGSSSVSGYGTSWEAISSGGTSSYSPYMFPTGFWATAVFPDYFWAGSTSSSSPSYVYIKRKGEYTVYSVDEILSDTSLTITGSYDPEDSSIAAYSSTTSYHNGSVVSFDGSLWVQSWSSSILNIPPIATYSSSASYRYSSTVLYSGNRYFCKSYTAITNIVPTNATYWRACTDADFASSRYWRLFNGYDYQIVYSTTENYHLPIITAGATDKWAWFRKAIQVLDTYL